MTERLIVWLCAEGRPDYVFWRRLILAVNLISLVIGVILALLLHLLWP